MPHPEALGQLLDELTRLAKRAGGLPWEEELSVDVDRGQALRVVAQYVPGRHQCTLVAGEEVELTEEVQQYLAAMNPAVCLLLVRELRRFSLVEEAFGQSHRRVLSLEAFLRRRGLTRHAERFMAIHEQLEEIRM